MIGDARDRLADAAVEAYRADPEHLAPEYRFFPQPPHEPYSARFNAFRGQLGDAQGVPRSDKAGRRRDVERQFRFFDAPIGLIFTMDRRLEWASFICYGCFLQNIMLAARARVWIPARSRSGRSSTPAARAPGHSGRRDGGCRHVARLCRRQPA
ncbi:hypothetical protein ACTMU2_26840 [Cupriavidus basilensis]